MHTLIPRTYEYVTYMAKKKRLCKCDQVKDPEVGVYLILSGWPYVITRVLIRGPQEESESQEEVR